MREIEIKIEPIPTRIFGIGLHKTGTTSLHHALKILGFNSAHWKSVRWAKRIWNEMANTGTSQTIEENYALADLPIPLLFRQLDMAYPGSKFILTIREEGRWIRSVENHWSTRNNFLDTWKKENGFSHELHRALYGQSHFNVEIFLSRYRRHNREVMEYFSDRSDDLLILNLEWSSIAKWRALCHFFGKDIPPVPYPSENVQSPHEGDYCI